MNSVEKIHEMLEQIGAQTDAELAEMIPIPVSPLLIRGALAGLSTQVPQDPAQVDQLIENASGMLLTLQSDPEPAIAELEAGDQAEDADVVL